MISITIEDTSSLGKQINHRAAAAGITPLALLHGIAFDAFNRHVANYTEPEAPAHNPATLAADNAAITAAPAAALEEPAAAPAWQPAAPAAEFDPANVTITDVEEIPLTLNRPA